MSVINLILIACAGIGGFLFHLFTKPKSVNNQQVIDDVNSLQNKVNSNNTAIQNQQQAIINNDKKAEDEKTSTNTMQSDVDIINRNLNG